MRNLNDVIERFDFNKVHKVMVYLDWKWCISGNGMEIPTVEQMKICVDSLAWCAYNSLLKGDLETTYAATGGFKVTTIKTENGVEFVVEFILAQSL